MTKIIAFAGKKQSGKNTATNYLVGLMMESIGLIDEFAITDKGHLYVPAEFIQEDGTKIRKLDRFEPLDRRPFVRDWMAQNLWQYVKVYSFADLLKEHVCIDILGLTEEQCYGTDEQKDTLTHLRWENMPGVLCYYEGELYVDNDHEEKPINGSKIWATNNGHKDGDEVAMYHNPGPMTAREVMQFVGTNIFRRMMPDVWAHGTVNKIMKEGSNLAIICDCRFPNEVEATQSSGGKVVRLTRDVCVGDTHESELALDEDKFDWAKFDAILDNTDATIAEQNLVLCEILATFGWLEFLEIEEAVSVD